MTLATPTGRPLLSFVLITYNQAQYICEAVKGAFAQTYQPLEIVLSDDCSSDRTFEIMREMVAGYIGPHIVRLNRNEHNLGLIGHVNRAVELATGELLVMAAGDDVSLPERSKSLHSFWEETDYEADGLCSGYFAVTPEGAEVVPAPQRLTVDEICTRGTVKVLGATAAWSRRLIRTWGHLPQDSLSEDRVLSFRALLGGGVVAVPQSLVRYRVIVKRGTQNQAAWPARRIWELRRAHQFFCVYLRDLDREFLRESPMGADPARWRRAIERSIRTTLLDLRLLHGGRIGALAYICRLLLGLTHFKPRVLGRVRPALSLFWRRVVRDEKQPALDATDHSALKIDVGGGAGR